MERPKRVLVVGMARSGVAAASLLAGQGVRVRLSDAKGREQLKEALAPLENLEGVEYRLGEPVEGLLDDVDQVVISPGVPIGHPVVDAARARGIELIGELELAFRYARGRLIAITGTNGKTTTTTLLGEICKNAGQLTFVVGNIGLPYASVAAGTRDTDAVVCEVSSFQMETVRTFHPSIAAILNITEDHLNRHGTMENYIALKARIFENQVQDDCLVLNYDDPALVPLAERAPGRVAWFSRTQVPPVGAFILGGAIVYGSADAHRCVCPADEVFIPGPHNLENALAAAAIAIEAGVPVPVIRHTLRTFKGVEHRCEFVRTLEGISYINDSKGTNVDSTRRAIAAMKAPTVLIAGGSSKQVDMLPLARAIAEGPIAHVVLVGATADEIARALDQVGYTSYARAGMDFERAVNMARSLAVEGGNVLLSPACASFDLFRDYEHRGAEFKRIVGALAPRTD
ncbi:MAG: UDP-N-acetylmuramoyl-L-alanine--D-glutamate ligase [Christensenellaceae bacterium]|nr:UDP-N-acetylmuramoyl-L-alanine--D-glutamate ligase [Christensenellaceae bacterium]